MEKLDQKYIIELDSIKGAIQSSDVLAAYLDDEEEESYQALREAFEPQIEAIYERVSSENPLQLMAFEEKLLDPEFEGLYLSRVLGYAALRGEIDDKYRYKRPQDHFKKILLAICQSSNFDLIKTRIGQGVQVGFALSSGIWITNLIEQVETKRVRNFLKAQVDSKFRDVDERKRAYNNYARQFSSIHYQSAEFPRTKGELKVLISSLLAFLLHRVETAEDNSSLVPNIKTFLNNDEFKYGQEYVRVLYYLVNFFDLEASDKKWLKETLNTARKEYQRFNQDYFEYHEMILQREIDIDATIDNRVIEVLDKSIEDDLTAYYSLMEVIHTKGYIHDDTIQQVRSFYDSHEGLSTINECLRLSILGHFRRLLRNLSVDAYTDFFEMHKVFAVYMQIFNNQQFNQDLKELGLEYIRKLLKTYTDKRGKDYQEIKKFVSQTYLDLGFMKEKQIVELFKTRRKKRKAN